MTKAHMVFRTRGGCKGATVRGGILACVCLYCLLGSGCVSLPWKKKANDEGLSGPSDTMVLRGGGLEKQRGYLDPALERELDAAHRLFMEKDYAGAEARFASILTRKKLPVNVAEEVLFHEAECQFLVKNYRAAEGTYRKHLKNYRNGQHAQQSIQRLFFIADYWLEGTRAEMQAKTGEEKKWFVMPANLQINFSKDLPGIDIEGRAVAALEDVRLHDIGGTYGEQACFYIGTVKFFRENYRDADYYFTQLYQQYPNSKLAPKAIKQAIICKQISNGGTSYDSRSVEETRKLLDIAPAAYPSLANKERDWLERQLISVNLQQADRDFNIAEFYRRTGHPGSAHFYYEIVRRSYPNTEYARKATQHMQELRVQVERENGPVGTGSLDPGAGRALPGTTLPGATGPGPTMPPAGRPTVPAPGPAAPRILPPGVAPTP